MPGDTYPKFRAAAVQAAPVFLDRDATIDKLDTLVQKAVDAGADLIVLGESFIPAFPVWNLIYAPMDQHGFFRRMFENAVQVPGPHTRRLSEIAKRHRVILSVGITEKGSISMGTLFNTNLLFDRDGTLLNRHRKLVPTWAEKLTWANGDASYLRPEETDIGHFAKPWLSHPAVHSSAKLLPAFASARSFAAFDQLQPRCNRCARTISSVSRAQE